MKSVDDVSLWTSLPDFRKRSRLRCRDKSDGRNTRKCGYYISSTKPIPMLQSITDLYTQSIYLRPIYLIYINIKCISAGWWVYGYWVNG